MNAGADVRVEIELPGTGALGTITGSSDDYFVIGAIQRSGEYEKHVMTFLANVARPADVCLDVGANIGVMALLLARLCPDGEVYAFEPGATSCDYLRRNVRDNDLGNVQVEQLGLYDVTDTLMLSVEAHHPGGAHLERAGDERAASEGVHVTRLDDWMTAHELERIDIIKMDIEGAELRAIDGAAATLREHRPLMIVECNPVALQRFQRVSADELVRHLAAIYGAVYYLEGPKLRAVESPEHAARLLEVLGVLDLVCGERAAPLAEPAPHRSRARRWARRVFPRRVRLPEMHFMYAVSYDADFGLEKLVGPAGSVVTVPVHLRNTSEVWYSSTFPNHPVHASYHWLDGDDREIERDGARTVFPEPLAPGRAADLDLTVALPSVPGDYVLVFALVQEGFAWSDELRPDLARRLPVRVH